jgi:glycosyltransferase involved in cell wall biosynthesis
MRVVMVSKALVVGAYQRKLEELARLGEIELTAVVPPEWRDRRSHVKLERAHTAGYELMVAPLIFAGQYHLHFYPTLGAILKRTRPDIVHMDEEPYNLATWHGLRLAEAAGARGVFFTWQNLNRRYPWPFRAFEQANYRRAAHVIAGNRTAVDVLTAKGYRGPVTVIPQFGVDPAIFHPTPEGAHRTSVEDTRPEPVEGRPFDTAYRPVRARTAPADLPPPQTAPPPFHIGYAGSLIPEKGVDLLLRACAALPDRGWRLTILGDGPERPRLTALAGETGIAGQVTFLGHRPSTQTPDIYRTFDALVLPSVSRPNWVEQFGRVLTEAMACGVPVVGAASGEIPNVIGDAGLVFPEGDAAALCDALTRLLADPILRRDLAGRGRARVLAHFTQAQVAAATYRVYQAVLAHGKATQSVASVAIKSR